MASEFANRQKNDIIRDISSLGSLFFYLFLMMFFAVKDYPAFKKLLVGLILIYVVTIIIRSFYFKERPQKYSHHSVVERLDASSFPSLHAARVGFLSLSFINYFNNKFVSVILLVIALIVAYSRIHLKKHDWKDVSAGIVLGILAYFAVGYFV